MLNRKCQDDSCDLSHCVKCGSHMMGGYLEHGAICDGCQEFERESLEDMRNAKIECRLEEESEKFKAW